MKKLSTADKWRAANPERVKKYYRDNYLKRRKEILAYNEVYRKKNWTRISMQKRDRTRKVTKELRQKIYEKLGDQCVKCGVNDIRLLCIDHIFGGGRQEVKIKFNNNMLKYLIHVLEDETGKYQILCHNCNWIKRFENNEVRKSKGNPYEKLLRKT